MFSFLAISKSRNFIQQKSLYSMHTISHYHLRLQILQYHFTKWCHSWLQGNRAKMLKILSRIWFRQQRRNISDSSLSLDVFRRYLKTFFIAFLLLLLGH